MNKIAFCAFVLAGVLGTGSANAAEPTAQELRQVCVIKRSHCLAIQNNLEEGLKLWEQRVKDYEPLCTAQRPEACKKLQTYRIDVASTKAELAKIKQALQ